MNKEIESKIVSIFKKGLDLDNMDYDKLVEAPLSTLNMNSITFIKVIVDIELEFGIEVDPESLDINVFQNIESVTSYVEIKIAEEA